MLRGPSLLLKEVKPGFLLLFLKALGSLLTLTFGSGLAAFCSCWMRLWPASSLEETL